MRIGFVQFAPALGNLTATTNSLESLLAGSEPAELLVLPELCNSGYNFQSPQQARELAESVSDSPFLRFVESTCRKHRMHIVTGLNELDGDRIYNSAVLVGPDGVVGIYRKLHLFVNEKDYFTPGDAGLPVFDISSCKVGMLVCFDWMFPEVWRGLALKGADIICHPSNLVLPGLAQSAVPIHALINRVYVVTANRVGSEGTLTFTGRSVIAAPDGELLAQGAETGDDVISVEIDATRAADKTITSRNDAFADRRPDQYVDLVRPQ